MKARALLPILFAALFPSLVQAQFALPTGTSGTSGAAGTAGGTYTMADGTSFTYTGTGNAIGANASSATININGTITTTDLTGGARGLRFTGSNTNTFTVTVGAGGSITTLSNDAVQNNDPAATINFTNLGSIIVKAGPADGSGTGYSILTGQALDFASSTAGTITNGSSTNSSALLKSSSDDAVRLGSNMTLTNYGSIIADGPINDNPANNAFNSPATSTAKTYSYSRGVEIQGSNNTVVNYGTITGAQHGVDAGDASYTNISVTNYGTITGQNGTGVGGDVSSASATNFTVTNYGTIIGAYAGAGHIVDRAGLASVDGDGDGVDVDGAATIVNYGTIKGTGAGGYDTNGRANKSEGITIGGGIVTNYGTISGTDFGITVNNDSNTDGSRSGSTATTITNYAGGVIQGLNGYAIRLENKTGTAADDDTLVNYGTITGGGTIPTGTVLMQSGTADTATIGTLNGVSYSAASNAGSARFIRGDGAAIQMGEGNDVLKNYGTIIGNTGRAVSMEGGNDTVVIGQGSRIVGLVDGGAGTNTLTVLTPGLTDAKKTALAAGQTVYINGTPYVNFTSFTGSTTATYSSLSTSPATKGIATFLDNSTSVGTNTQQMMSLVAAASDTESAMKQLTPQALLSSNAGIAANAATQASDALGGRLSTLRQGGGGGIDISGLNVVDPSLAPVFNDTRTLLAGIDMGRTLSDSRSPIMAKSTPASELLAKKTGAFVSGNAVFGDKGGNSEIPGYNFTTVTAIVGIDHQFTPAITLGTFGGYSHTDANVDGFGSKSKADTGLFGVYGAWTRDDWFVNGTVSYGHSSYDNTRIALGTQNTSSPDGNQVSVQNAFGKDITLGREKRWTLTPEAGYQYTATFVDSFTEQGPAALSVDSMSTDSLRSHVGAKVRYDFTMPWGKITPSFGAAWKHEFLDSTQNVHASFTDTAGSDFTTATQSTGKDFGVVAIGLGATFSQSWSATLGYSYTAGGLDYNAHSVTGGVRYSF